MKIKICVLFILMCLFTTSSGQWYESVRCRSSDFRCNDGSCIRSSSVCNGYEDCGDGSDEETCYRSRHRSSCPGGTFNCGDSCIDLRLACDGKKHCADGSDESKAVCNIQLRCFPAPLIDNGSIDVISETMFNDKLAPGGRFQFTINCHKGYSLSKANFTCINGTWTGITPVCVGCGKTSPSPRRTTPEGDSYQYGLSPWHVGVYSKMKKPYKLICGGSLITFKLVISAAQCFWDDAVGLLPAPIFAVAAGKAFSGWDDDRDYDAQTSDIDEVKVPELFLGETNNLMHNIALVTLASHFEFNRYVSPVCLDYGSLFVRPPRKIENNMVGIWRRSPRNINLQISDFVDVDNCGNYLSEGFLNYMTSDKTCAVYNGPPIGQQLPGSGLVYWEEGFGATLIYLEGVVSVGKHQWNSPVSTNFLITTKIVDYKDFIKPYYNIE